MRGLYRSAARKRPAPVSSPVVTEFTPAAGARREDSVRRPVGGGVDHACRLQAAPRRRDHPRRGRGGLRTWLIDSKAMVQPAGSRRWMPLGRRWRTSRPTTRPSPAPGGEAAPEPEPEPAPAPSTAGHSSGRGARSEAATARAVRRLRPRRRNRSRNCSDPAPALALVLSKWSRPHPCRTDAATAPAPSVAKPPAASTAAATCCATPVAAPPVAAATPGQPLPCRSRPYRAAGPRRRPRRPLAPIAAAPSKLSRASRPPRRWTSRKWPGPRCVAPLDETRGRHATDAASVPMAPPPADPPIIRVQAPRRGRPS
jgi:hypothetical protein